MTHFLEMQISYVLFRWLKCYFKAFLGDSLKFSPIAIHNQHTENAKLNEAQPGKTLQIVTEYDEKVPQS